MPQPRTAREPAATPSASDGACLLCGSREADRLWEGSDKKFRGPGRFTYVRCRECGLVFLHPRPPEKEMGLYYPDYVTPVRARADFSFLERARGRLKRMTAEAWYGYAADRADGRPRLAGLLQKGLTFPLRRYLRQVPRRHPEGRVLDIGCGSGGYLAFLATLGWICTGVEPGPNSRAYATGVLGLNVHPGPLGACGFSDGIFDVVTMWHVIEHLPDPLETLREIRRILKPNGLLLLRTPNAESLEAHLFGGNFYGLDPPRHLYLFSPGTLRRLLERGGFTVTRTGYQYHPTDASRSLLYLAEESGHLRSHRVLSRWIRTIELGLTSCLPLRGLAGRGAAMHVEARKVTP